MKKKNILLDFTSLLDIIMVILFFFILFSKFETDDFKQNLKEQQNEIESQKAEIQDKKDHANRILEEAEIKIKNAQILLDEANEAENRSGNNVNAISEFNESKNLKLSLCMNKEEKTWSVKVIKGENEIGILSKDSEINMVQSLKQIFEENNYSVEDTILLELFYDATESGTTSAYNTINRILTQVKKDYKHCFYSETDKSIL